MEAGTPFDLDDQVRLWRRRYAANPNFWPAELDELEANLRDRFDEFILAGYPKDEAFEKAVAAVGTPTDLEREFRDGRLPNSVRGRTARLSNQLFPPLVLNYIRSATRSMKRSGLHTFISAAGLAVALACCIWIVIFVTEELGFDAFHGQSDNIVRLTIGTSANTPEYWGPAVTDNVPGIRESVRINNQVFAQTIFRVDETVFPERNGIFADASMFDVFSWRLEKGDPETALERPYTMVISREMIKRYGLPENPIGSVIDISGVSNTPRRSEYEITGVLAAPDGPSHISFDYVLSFETILFLEDNGEWGTPFNWTNRVLKTYLLLEPNVDRENLAAQISATLRSFIPDERYSLDNVELQALTSIHLESDKRSEFPGGGSLKYVYLLGGLALLVLVLAMVNYVNLATSRSMQRSKEVGMRKAIGATRGQIRWQYLTESVIIVFLSLLVALVVAWLMQDFVRSVTMKPLSLGTILRPGIFASILLVVVLTGLAAGFYPAVVLSRFESVEALRPGASSTSRMSLFRRGMVVVQFAVSIGLIATTLIMNGQMRYVEQRPLGYDTANVFVVDFGHSTRIVDNIDTIVSRLRSDPRVASASASHSLPTGFLNGFSYYPEGSGPDEYVQLGNLALDPYLMDVLRIEPLVGRTFIPDAASDSLAFVVNETAARELGWAPDASILGKRVDWPLGELGFSAPIVGVVRDFHYNSLHRQIEPIIFNLSRFGSSYLLVRPTPESTQAVLADLESTWTAIEPDYPFNYAWMADRVGAQYMEERRLMRLFTYTAGLALVIACLGLFGLASFEIRRRFKEIAIRKILGAGAFSIARAFTTEFAVFLIIGMSIATPVAYLVMRHWLESFAYRMSIGPWPFLLALMITLAVALASVSVQTARAAFANPTESIRT